MAKTEIPEKRKPVLIEYMDGDTTEPEPTDEELAFSQFQTEFAESDTYAKITVYRQPTGPGNRPGQKKLAFLFECGVDEFTYSQLLSKLRDEYGSGTYRLQARDSQGTMKFNRAVEIEATKRTPTNGAPESVGDLMRGFQEMMTAQQERTEQLIARLRTEPAKPASDPMETAMRMFALVMGAITPVLGAAKPAEGGVLAEIEKLTKIQDFMGGLGGGRETSAAESNFYDLATQGLKTVAPLLANLPAVLASRQGAPIPQPHVIEHEPTPAQGAPRQNIPRNTPPQGPQAENVNLRNQINLLVGQAEAGTSAEDLANMVLNMTPDEKVAELKAFISRPTLIDEMAAYNPAVGTKHRPYFEALKTAILRMLAEEESQGPEAA